MGRLFGNRPQGWGGVERGQQDAKEGARSWLNALRGGSRSSGRICPTCNRPVASGRDTCPIGHFVG